jgi:hypothetical protein
MLHDQEATIASMRAAAAVPAAPAPRVQGHLDSADIAGNRVSLRGWAFDASCACDVDAIVVRVDGREVARSTTGAPRPDVARVLEQADAGQAGFEFEFEGPAGGVDGCAIEVVAEARDGGQLALRPAGCEASATMSGP